MHLSPIGGARADETHEPEPRLFGEETRFAGVANK